MARSVDREFLAKVQAAGLMVRRVEEKHLVAQCQVQGCGMLMKLSILDQVPDHGRDFRRANSWDVPTYDDMRKILRRRREEISLTIAEVEDIVGFANDHLAKIENDRATRIPNAMTLFDWIHALGFQVALVPGEMPATTLQTIADTRDSIPIRERSAKASKRKRLG